MTPQKRGNVISATSRMPKVSGSSGDISAPPVWMKSVQPTPRTLGTISLLANSKNYGWLDRESDNRFPFFTPS